MTETVIFACVHNAGRSQMAAAWLRTLGGERVEVFSGGSDPGTVVNPNAVRSMAEVGIDIAAEDPSGLPVAQVRPIRDDIERRVRDLMTELGIPVTAG